MKIAKLQEGHHLWRRHKKQILIVDFDFYYIIAFPLWGFFWNHHTKERLEEHPQTNSNTRGRIPVFSYTLLYAVQKQLSVALLTSISSSFPSSANTTLSFSLWYRWRHWGMERKWGSNNTVLRELAPKQAGSKDSPPNQAEPGVERGGAASPKAAWASPLLLLMVLELPTTSLPRDLVSS